jgi:hypothetical protein
LNVKESLNVGNWWGNLNIKAFKLFCILIFFLIFFFFNFFFVIIVFFFILCCFLRIPVLSLLAGAPQPVTTPCRASEKGNFGTPNLININHYLISISRFDLNFIIITFLYLGIPGFSFCKFVALSAKVILETRSLARSAGESDVSQYLSSSKQ